MRKVLLAMFVATVSLWLVACETKGEIKETEKNDTNKVSSDVISDETISDETTSDETANDNEEDIDDNENKDEFNLDEEAIMKKQRETMTVAPELFSQHKGDDWVRAITDDGLFIWIPYENVMDKEKYKRGTDSVFHERDGGLLFEKLNLDRLPDLETYPNPRYIIEGEQWGFNTGVNSDCGILYYVPKASPFLGFGLGGDRNFGQRTKMDLIYLGFGYKDEALIGLEVKYNTYR